MSLLHSRLPPVLVQELERLGCTYDLSRTYPARLPTPAGERVVPEALQDLFLVKFPRSLLGQNPPFPTDAGRDLGIRLGPLYGFEMEDHKDAIITLGSGNGDDYYRISLEEAARVPLEELSVYKHLRDSRVGWDYQVLDDCFFGNLLQFFQKLEPWPR
jgi:hypothetical protein